MACVGGICGQDLVVDPPFRDIRYYSKISIPIQSPARSATLAPRLFQTRQPQSQQIQLDEFEIRVRHLLAVQVTKSPWLGVGVRLLPWPSQTSRPRRTTTHSALLFFRFSCLAMQRLSASANVISSRSATQRSSCSLKMAFDCCRLG